ncbi:DNA primase [Paenibacillus cymbidii]|uniref:hypothetical protein n=1 Tax=Paenibacillus cymbidii TaxID=1639034 RepID=UPI00108089EF|nr:hypothetical protein [Paenibacillus cymbidii]
MPDRGKLSDIELKIRSVMLALDMGECVALSKIPYQQYEQADGNGKKRLLKAKLEDICRLAGVSMTENLRCLMHEGDDRPSMHLYPDRFYCFACQSSLDLFDLMKHLLDERSFEKRRQMAERWLVAREDEAAVAVTYAPVVDTKSAELIAMINRYGQPADANPYCMAYLRSRGITPETARRIGLLCYENPYTNDRFLAVPCGAKHYVVRVYANRSGNADKYRNAGEITLFQAQSWNACRDETVVFVTESSLCAIVLAQMNFQSVALNGVNYKRLLDAADVIARKKLKIVMLCDNEEVGLQCGVKCAEAIRKLPSSFDFLYHHKLFSPETILTKHKDVNEAYAADPRQTEEALRKIEMFAQRREDEEYLPGCIAW